MKLTTFIFKAFNKIIKSILTFIDKLLTYLYFKGNNVGFSNFQTTGIPFVMVAREGTFNIGKNFKINKGIEGNPLGCYSANVPFLLIIVLN
jgi:hypothetical protein